MHGICEHWTWKITPQEINFRHSFRSHISFACAGYTIVSNYNNSKGNVQNKNWFHFSDLPLKASYSKHFCHNFQNSLRLPMEGSFYQITKIYSILALNVSNKRNKKKNDIQEQNNRTPRFRFKYAIIIIGVHRLYNGKALLANTSPFGIRNSSSLFNACVLNEAKKMNIKYIYISNSIAWTLDPITNDFKWIEYFF